MTDGNGTWIATWFSNENLSGAGTDDDIFFSRSMDNGATWSASQLLNSNATVDVGDKDWRPVLMTDGGGNWIAAWNYNDNDTDVDISFSRSTDNGATWSASQALNSNAAQDTSGAGGSYPGIDNRPAVLSCGADTWIAVWQSREDLNNVGIDSDIFFSRSTDDGASWSASQALNSNASTDFGDDLFGHEE
jgi:hypothetical protein